MAIEQQPHSPNSSPRRYSRLKRPREDAPPGLMVDGDGDFYLRRSFALPGEVWVRVRVPLGTRTYGSALSVLPNAEADIEEIRCQLEDRLA